MSVIAVVEHEKLVVARAAADIVESGMILGLGTGSTVAYLLPALAARRLDVRCVTSSRATERAARDLGMRVESFSGPGAPARVDLTIDGADQVAPSGWLVKGGGAAHTREKALAAAAERFVVIVGLEQDRGPAVAADPARAPRVRPRGHARTAGARAAARRPAKPGRRRDRRLPGRGRRPRRDRCAALEHHGLIEHGLFAPALVSEILVARGERVDRITTP